MSVPQPILDAINEALENCPEDKAVDVVFSTIMFGSVPMLSVSINIVPKEMVE